MNSHEILALYVVVGTLFIGSNGLIVAIYSASKRTISAPAWNFISSSMFGSAQALFWSILAIMTIDLFQEPAVGWRIYSALFALALLFTVVGLWTHAYRIGLRAPLVITVSAFICMSLLAFNVMVSGKAWLYVAAVGAYLFMVGAGSFMFLLFEMHQGSTS